MGGCWGLTTLPPLQHMLLSAVVVVVVVVGYILQVRVSKKQVSEVQTKSRSLSEAQSFPCGKFQRT